MGTGYQTNNLMLFKKLFQEGDGYVQVDKVFHGEGWVNVDFRVGKYT